MLGLLEELKLTYLVKKRVRWDAGHQSISFLADKFISGLIFLTVTDGIIMTEFAIQVNFGFL